MSDVYFGNSAEENAHLKYEVPPARLGLTKGSVAARELNGYVHNPEEVMARIQELIEADAERANRTVKRKMGHIPVVETVELRSNATDYLGEAPQLPPTKTDRFTNH